MAHEAKGNRQRIIDIHGPVGTRLQQALCGKAIRKIKRDYDRHVYRWRHLIEKFFAKIKEFRAIATRCEKTTCSYAANWHLAATMIASR
ncbi:hypothetical protein IT41_03995 [Paracoccus halophilus]|uniref:Uncharacterized protein n=1 Tax=Paracoccus halophilus TaxID=376733 RepID=A0A099F6G3_9RHOB|nr:hypothetical protein IT41_03995 [Paracoccus halophilus]